MKKHIHRFFTLSTAVLLALGAAAQDFDILLFEEFNDAQSQTPPAPWAEFVQDPSDPALGGDSDGWETGVTSYTGAWNVPTSLDNSGFAIANDDVTDQDRRDDQLLVGFFDLTSYDSLTILIDKFFDSQYGSSGFFLVGNATQAVIFPIAQGAVWGVDELNVVNGETYVTAAGPLVFDDQMVIGFVHNDNSDWRDGLAVDNVILAGWLPPCETSGLTQVPAAPVAAVGGSTATISAAQDLGGEFSVVTNIQGSTEYTIDHTGGAYATVRTGSATGPVLDFGDTPLTITTLSTDDLYIIWSADNACSPGDGSTNTSTITGGAQVCAADAGGLFQISDVNACIGDTLVVGAQFPGPAVPAGYQLVYVVTDGAGNVIAGPLTEPEYVPTAEGAFVLHTLVLDPADQATILAQVPNGAQAVADLFEENGGLLCGSLDLNGAGFNVLDCPDNNDCEDATPLECGSAVAGTNVNGSVDITGFGETVWYSFQGNGQDVTFSNCGAGDFDSFFVLWTGDCNSLESQTANDDGLGAGCGLQSELSWYMHPDTVYYLSVSGLGEGDVGTFTLSATCTCPAGLDAGTLTPDAATACLDGNGEAVLSATEGTAPAVPEGYSVAYVLTSGGTDYIIEQTGATPDFTVTEGGEYTIHTLVFTNTLDLTVVVPGVTPASAVLGIVSGDDNICAALDVIGTGTITVNAPEVGATVADASEVCLLSGTADIGAESDGNEVVPAGYSVVYVLTDADNSLEILDANATGDFTVNAEGNYIIHTFVYDPVAVPDLTPFVGQSATVVVAAIADGTVCAALDVAGAEITVVDCNPPANDLCADAISVACGDVVSGSTEFATSTGASDCQPTGLGVWYTIVGDGSIITLDLSNSDFDTYLGVTTSCGGTCVADDDDSGDGLTSLVTWESVDQTVYYIQISSYEGTIVGNYEMEVTCVSPPDPLANDEPCDAISLVAGLNGAYTNVGATAAVGETGSVAAGTDPGSTCQSQDGWCSFELDVTNSTWFSLVAPASGKLTISIGGTSTLGGTFDSQIALFSAASCQDIVAGSGVLVGANDDNPNTGSGASFLSLCDLTPGATYYLMVDGYDEDESADYTVTLTEEDLSADFGSSAIGLVADFIDASTTTNTIVDWAWDFDDAGATSDEEDPTHTFSADGTYNVCLTVTDENGCDDTYCEDVQVADITISVSEALERGMVVYPNPSNGEFAVEVRGVEADVQFNVLDLTGRVIFTEGAVLNGNFRKEFNIDAVSGTYLLQILTKEGAVTRKLQVK